MNYLDGLNERQKEAAEHIQGPLLIIAGAGAGKTKTITHRIAHLVQSGIHPRSILAVTFTNKAAGEMRTRILALLPPNAGGVPFIATFHSLGVRLLREFHEQAGLPRAFNIWDRDDSLRVVKRALERMDVEQYQPRNILSGISRLKGDGVTLQEFAGKVSSFREKTILEAWREYDQALAAEGALDFDDLLARTLQLLKSSKEVLSLLQNRFQHITIDEYQDTNKSQYEIARLLAGDKCNICVVGDIDQNIYSWRGADIEHLLSFENSFPGAKVVTLEQNYRSTRTILAAANAVIAKNTRRREKNLYTDNGTGDPIIMYSARNEIDEAWFISHSIRQLLEKGTKASEIAILYRENFQSRGLEEALLAFSIPYHVLGTRFFERKEVKDTLSYLRAALNPQNKLDLERIVGTPPRGIGKVTLEKMLRGEDESLPAAARMKVAMFRDTITRIHHAVTTLPASEAVRYCVESSGMEAMYHKDAEEGHERLDNIRELVNLAVRFDYLTSPEGIEQLLEEAALQSDQDNLEDDRATVSLMTVHASKGLEFDAVFVTGLEQGLFPSIRDDGRDTEEERRLFYVAVTRARKHLFLTYAAQRMKYGSREFTLPSEFLEDIDSRLVLYQSRDDGEKKEPRHNRYDEYDDDDVIL